MRGSLITLAIALPATLACGPYMPRPTANPHPIVKTTLDDGTQVRTTDTAGELLVERDGKTQTVSTPLWQIRDIEVVDGALVVAGSSWGQPELAVQGASGLWVPVYVESTRVGEIVDLKVTRRRGQTHVVGVIESDTGDTEPVESTVSMDALRRAART